MTVLTVKRTILCACVISTNLFAQETVGIDYSKTYQTWEGYGAFGAEVPWTDPRYKLEDSFFDLYFDTLNFNVYRTQCFPPENFVGFERTHDEMRKMQDAADRKGKEIKWITSIWSAPSHMKSNKQLKRGGYVTPENFTAFADYAASRCIDEQFESIGITPYALSFQNEPNLPTWYNSGVYNPTQLNDMIKACGDRFKEKKPDVKIYGPEGAIQLATIELMEVMKDDPETFKVLDAVAAHSYWARIGLPIPGHNSEWADPVWEWQEISDMASKYNKNVWQTEVGGWVKEWTLDADKSKRTEGGLGGLLHLHSDMYLFHRYGMGTLWCHWMTSNQDQNDVHCLIMSGQLTPTAYCYRHYSAFIEPGAVRVESGINNDKRLFTNAWYHNENKTLTITLLNLSDQAQVVHLEADPLPGHFQRYLTANISDNCKYTGEVSASEPINVPPNSISTLYGYFDGDKPDGATSSTAPVVRPVHRTTHEGQMNIYDTRGRVVSQRALADMIKVTKKGTMNIQMK